MRPNFREEKRLWRKGYKSVVGLDEAGRGPLSGPVVAAAVMVNSKFKTQNFHPPRFCRAKLVAGKKLNLKSQIFNLKSNLKEVKDSKQLSPKKREEIYKILINHSQIKWGTGRVSEKVIDKINILEATKLAMKRAVKNLERKSKPKVSKLHSTPKKSDRLFCKSQPIDFLVVDGRMKLDLSVSQKSIVKADEKVFSCAAASILAKVWRDRIMRREHKKYPQYGFDTNKGYPTRFHRKMLKKYGPCKIHRYSYRPVKVVC